MLREPASDPDGAAVLASGNPRISVIVPLAGWNADARRCVERLGQLIQSSDEVILVPDGFHLDAVLPTGFRVVPLATHGGPAAARNAGAAAAAGEILFFADSDVLLRPDAVKIVRTHFRQSEDVALFGSYDDAPSVPTTVSRFRNLLHHFQHQSHAGPVRSFWTGCGAIRRSAFDALGGFSLRYDRPAMEDIELGARVVRAGGKIRLDSTLQCTHLKHWTLRSMIVTDVRDRAIPWARLIYREGISMAMLNADRHGRQSLALTAIAAGSLVLGVIWPVLWCGSLAAWLALLVNEGKFLALLRRCGGARLWAAGTLLLPVYFLSGAVGLAYVTVEVVLGRLGQETHAGR